MADNTKGAVLDIIRRELDRLEVAKNEWRRRYKADEADFHSFAHRYQSTMSHIKALEDLGDKINAEL